LLFSFTGKHTNQLKQKELITTPKRLSKNCFAKQSFDTFYTFDIICYSSERICYFHLSKNCWKSYLFAFNPSTDESEIGSVSFRHFIRKNHHFGVLILKLFLPFLKYKKKTHLLSCVVIYIFMTFSSLRRISMLLN
jgi:hypothetical protein